MKSVLSVAVLGVLMFSVSASAQETNQSKFSIATTIGGTGIPDAIGQRCGRTGGTARMVEASGALVVRPWRLLTVQVDSRVASPFYGQGCDAVRFSFDTVYLGESNPGFFATSAARIGVETPASMPLLRISGGRGLVWGTRSKYASVVQTENSIGITGLSGPPTGFWVIGVAIGTRGRRHVLLEVDRMNTHVDAVERNSTSTPSGASTSAFTPIRVSPSWWSVRLGMEWALSR